MSTQPTAREAIRDVLATYCRGIDRRDRDLVRGCFHPHATDDHGTGPQSVDDFLDWCFGLLHGYDSTFHILGQSTFEFRPLRIGAAEFLGDRLELLLEVELPTIVLELYLHLLVELLLDTEDLELAVHELAD